MEKRKFRGLAGMELGPVVRAATVIKAQKEMVSLHPELLPESEGGMLLSMNRSSIFSGERHVGKQGLEFWRYLLAPTFWDPNNVVEELRVTLVGLKDKLLGAMPAMHTTTDLVPIALVARSASVISAEKLINAIHQPFGLDLENMGRRDLSHHNHTWVEGCLLVFDWKSAGAIPWPAFQATTRQALGIERCAMQLRMTRRQSFESQRPIMAPSLTSQRNSLRCSTISDRTVASVGTSDSRLNEIRELGEGLERLENKRLNQQRFVPSPEKTDNLSKLALGAKLERALRRRMTGQDAVMRKPIAIDEKEALKIAGAPN
ncbi:predicted protein [Uncinocarpus reesii 1704]|uniref:Uncharacterized protein n=1 Tax=Uncinocarpus reesii (strain UAMH 1704) TaxID=336963 RepID=C4JJU0_UNCRE|nr:uncharacterized protein UREG_01897 [Uncinocarpus reesii 1704]EEP77048.1 predicted protein [Uncinocarpus reesii 1704]